LGHENTMQASEAFVQQHIGNLSAEESKVTCLPAVLLRGVLSNKN
jgi:hypothetical protein